MTGFISARLRTARTFRDLTLHELAEQVGAALATLSYVENGKQKPKNDLVEAFGNVLGFEPEFFFAADLDEFTADECSFRRRATTPERVKKRVLAHGTLFGEVVECLYQKLELPAFDVPEIVAPRLADIDATAERCRVIWGLALDAPLASIGRLLEHHGVVLTQFAGDSEKIDAFSRYGRVSVVVLNTAKQSSSRSMFDIAHELGHLVMHRQGVGSRERELAADRFASAFLMPRMGFGRDFRAMPHVDWPHLFELKRHWHVSAAAIIRRAWDLGLIDAATYRRLNVTRSAKGYRRGEPFEPKAETPELVRLAFASLNDSGESPFAIAKQLHWKPETLAAVTGIEVDSPVEPEADVVPLSSARQRHAASS